MTSRWAILVFLVLTWLHNPNLASKPGDRLPGGSDGSRHHQRMTASWYGAHWSGRRTASGRIFSHLALTCAHKTMPFGTRLHIEYNGRRVVVHVTDRGPYILGRDLDLSWAAAKALGMVDVGVAQVRILSAIAPSKSQRKVE
jgi:rare lipoprotein A